MITKTIAIFFITVFCLSLFITTTVSAQGPNNPVSGFFDPKYAPPLTKLGDVGGTGYGLAEKLLTWFIAVFWIVAVGFVIWSAFTFLFANGDEGKIGEAKNRLKYALIAAVVALLSVGIKPITTSLLKGETGGSGGGGGFGSECISYNTEEQCGANSNCEWTKGVGVFGCTARECKDFNNASECNSLSQCEWVSDECMTIFTKCATNSSEATCNIQSSQCHWDSDTEKCLPD